MTGRVDRIGFEWPERRDVAGGQRSDAQFVIYVCVCEVEKVLVVEEGWPSMAHLALE